jgi:hypothetical protein
MTFSNALLSNSGWFGEQRNGERAVKEECLSKFILFGEASLRREIIKARST